MTNLGLLCRCLPAFILCMRLPLCNSWIFLFAIEIWFFSMDLGSRDYKVESYILWDSNSRVRLPAVKMMMIDHPEVEWFWWIDSNRDFHWYGIHSIIVTKTFVVYGWPNIMYYIQSWTVVKANYQWSIEVIDTWKSMDPMSLEYAKWGPIQKTSFGDRLLSLPVTPSSTHSLLPLYFSLLDFLEVFCFLIYVLRVVVVSFCCNKSLLQHCKIFSKWYKF